MRPQILEAMQFDGTSAGVERVVAGWRSSHQTSGSVLGRKYRGWDDRTGYLELEVKDFDHGCMGGDRAISEADGRETPWFIHPATSQKYYEEISALRDRAVTE